MGERMYYIVETVIFLAMAISIMSFSKIIEEKIFKKTDGSKKNLIIAIGIICLLNAFINAYNIFTV